MSRHKSCTTSLKNTKRAPNIGSDRKLLLVRRFALIIVTVVRTCAASLLRLGCQATREKYAKEDAEKAAAKARAASAKQRPRSAEVKTTQPRAAESKTRASSGALY